MNILCQFWDGMTVNGVRPTCGPAVARITHAHRGATLLCEPCLHAWLDNANDDPSIEPEVLHLLAT